MRKILLLLVALLFIGGYIYFQSSSRKSVTSGLFIDKTDSTIIERDTVKMFIAWLDSVGEETSKVKTYEDLKNVGPRQIADLKNQLGNVYVVLSSEDKDRIKSSMHVSFNRQWEKIIQISMVEFSDEIGDEHQFDDIMVGMHRSIIQLVDSAETLHEIIGFLINNYNSPIE